jgi:hypothetical protein
LKTGEVKRSLSSKPVEKKKKVSAHIYNKEECTRRRPSNLRVLVAPSGGWLLLVPVKAPIIETTNKA